jgi:hypothetical protein
MEMKRLFSLSFVLLAGRLFAGSAPAQQPVYVYLYADITDHVNVELSEDRLRRILPMIEQYRKQHPDAHVSATVLFSGAMSKAFAERNSQSHICDFVMDFIHRGVIQAGYDGADEPTYKQRPLIDFSNVRTPEDRWLARQTTADKLLTEGRDPLTGAEVAGSIGGLKEMQEVFGPAACIKGVLLAVPDRMVGMMPEVGADSEAVNAIRRYNTQAIMFGVPDSSPVHGPFLRKWSAAIGKDMSPTPDTSPELFWQDNVLRTSESNGPDLRLFHAYDAVAGFKTMAAKLDRSRIHVIHVELASQRNYLAASFKPNPLAYAYDHPDSPKLPADAGRARADVDAAYTKEDALMKWMAEEFFPANPGSRFVSSLDLKEMVAPGAGYSVSVSKLRSALEETLKTWGTDPVPPKYLLVDGRYLSMADMFQVMADALAEFQHGGKLPESVRLIPVYGPIPTQRDRGPATGEIAVASVATACTGLAARLHDDTWSPVPKNFIPGRVPVDGINLTAAQFLRLMAEALVSPSGDTKLTVKPTDMFWGLDATYFRTRSIGDEGAAWTYKPAVLKTAMN